MRQTDVLGCEVLHGVVDLVDQGEHGQLQLALVDLAARLEPGAVVVPGQAAQELEGFGGEVGGHGLVVSG